MLKLSLRAVVLLLLIRVTYSAPVQFGQRTWVMNGAARLDVGTYSAPLMTDWNCDGKKDLLVGQFELGRIRFYPNIGTNDAPLFDGFAYLMDDLAPLWVTYG